MDFRPSLGPGKMAGPNVLAGKEGNANAHDLAAGAIADRLRNAGLASCRQCIGTGGAIDGSKTKVEIFDLTECARDTAHPSMLVEVSRSQPNNAGCENLAPGTKSGNGFCRPSHDLRRLSCARPLMLEPAVRVL